MLAIVLLVFWTIAIIALFVMNIKIGLLVLMVLTGIYILHDLYISIKHIRRMNRGPGEPKKTSEESATERYFKQAADGKIKIKRGFLKF